MHRIRISLVGLIAMMVAFWPAAAWTQAPPPPGMTSGPMSGPNGPGGGGFAPPAPGGGAGGGGPANPPPSSDTSSWIGYVVIILGSGVATYVIAKSSRR